MELPLDPRARCNHAATDSAASDQERATLPRPANDDVPGPAPGREAPIAPTDTVRPIRAGPAAAPQTFVVVEGGDGLHCIEGVIVGGTLDANGAWDLDGLFTLRTEDGDLFRVQGWACITEVQ